MSKWGSMERSNDWTSSARISDQRELRRRYVKTKCEAYVSIAMSSTLVLFAACGLLFGILGVGRLQTQPVDSLCVDFVTIALAAGCGWIAYWGIRDVRETRVQAKQITYVPPVESRNTLPEELLLRASEGPPESMVRALVRPAASAESLQSVLLRITADTNARSL